MKVYNEEKTQLLTQYDLKDGYLKADELVVHIPEVQAVEEVSHYEVVTQYECGADVKKVIDVKGVSYSPAREEREEIFMFIPYTEAEKEARAKNALRERREVLLTAFDKWEKAVLRGREEDSEQIMAWFSQLLALDEQAFSAVPERIQYYL